MKVSKRQTIFQKQEIKQRLTPQLIQLMKTFHQPYSDWVASVKQESNENVLLEVHESDTIPPALSQTSRSSHIDNADVSEFTADAPPISLRSHLLSQIKLLSLSKSQHILVTALIEQLDNRGYFPDFNQTKTALMTRFAVSSRKLHDSLKIVQELEPEGVGARSLEDCLLIQVRHHDFEDKELSRLLEKVISSHLHTLANQDFERIAKDVDIPLSGVAAIAAFIKDNLNPNPGSNFSDSAHHHHIIPSADIQFQDGKVVVRNLEKRDGIKLSLSKKYLTLLSAPETDLQTRTFLKEKLTRAQQYIENYNKRLDSLEKLIRHIAKAQVHFITDGPLYLKPLLQKEVSAALNLSPSTISRLVSSKYIQTPHGLVSLKQLCPRNYFGKTSEQLQNIFRDLLKKHPDLSDQKLSNLLHSKGIKIARRTVTKYRHRLQASL